MVGNTMKNPGIMHMAQVVQELRPVTADRIALLQVCSKQ